ncbi:MAG: transposase [Balneolaceae bacterium]
MSADQVGKFEAKVFASYDGFLDKELLGPIWLSNKKVANIVAEALHFYDQSCYDLYAYTIMSNYVHLVFRHLESYDVDLPVTSIMKHIKSYSAKEANKLLDRKGVFWQPESYDRVIRDEDELENTIKYTIYNPVKAEQIEEWKQWPFTYCKPEFIGGL